MARGSGGCTLHNPHYDFNDAILPLGVSLLGQALAEARSGGETGDGEALIERTSGRRVGFFCYTL
jgi:hypothetical protein